MVRRLSSQACVLVVVVSRAVVRAVGIFVSRKKIQLH